MRLLILTWCFFSFYAGICQHNKINTDRPDQTEGTQVMGKKELQIEADFYYNYFEKEKSALISSNLIRLGLAKRAELRVVVEEGRQRDAFIETTQGVYPLSVGSKVSVIKEHKWIPNVSLIGYLQLPFVSKTSENKMMWAPAIIVATEYDISKLSIDVNLGLKGGAFSPQKAFMASTSFRLECSDKIQAFIEYFSQYPEGSHPRHNADTGMMYLFPINSR